MKKQHSVNLLFIVLALLLVNCTRSKIISKIDYDQLYAVWHNDDYKDSLSLVLKPEVDRALTLSNTVENRASIDSVLNKLRWTRDSISFFKLSTRAISYATAKSDDYLLASTYNNIGMYYHDVGIMDRTYYYYIKAENIYKALGDSIKIGEMEFYQARLLFEKGLTMESEIKISNALRILTKDPFNPIPIEANQLMAMCLIQNNDLEAAHGYYQKALAIVQKDFGKNRVLEHDKLQLAIFMIYLNLSDLAYGLEKFDVAKEYALKGLTYTGEVIPPLLVKALEGNVAICEMRSKLLSGEPIDEAVYLAKFMAVYNEAIKVNNLLFANHQMMTIADFYILIGQVDKALYWAEKSYELSKSRDIRIDQKDALEFILTHDDYKNRNQVLEVIALNNEILDLDYQTHNRFARIAYETEKIETENNKLRNDIFILVLVSLIIIIGLSLGGFIYRIRQKNRELSFIKSQQKTDESIYELLLEKKSIATEVKSSVRRNIVKDLHDGIVNGIFTIRFNLQQLRVRDENFKNALITELKQLEKSTKYIVNSLIDNELFRETKFISLIKDLVSFQKNQWNTNFKVEGKDAESLEEMTAIDKVNTYFIIREAVHNINKYSKASLCTISFMGDEEGVIIRIKDDGIGFNTSAIGGGIGIQSMKERALALGSELHVFSQINRGTEVIFKIKTN